MGLGLGLIFSCSPSKEEVIEDWHRQGWTQVRTHGIVKDFTRYGKLKSEKAQIIEAAWIEKGERKTKLYRQDAHHYLVLRFFCEDDDEFVVVMRRRK